MKIRDFYEKYRHGIPMILYGLIYLSWFNYIEKNGPAKYTIIHTPLDDYIPFVEIFIIPYLFWFLYMIGVVVYFFFTEKDNYWKSFIFLSTGMTVFLIISTLWPNGQHLRPAVMPRDNVFTHAIAALYKTDTPTNLWPSIHVYNSIGAHLAVVKSKQFENKKWVKNLSLFVAVSIILSTMFIKQHSTFDVLTAFLMAAIMYFVVYERESSPAYRSNQRNKEKHSVA